MSATNSNEVVQPKPTLILKLAVENVLIWLFWGLADFFGSHGHPFASDILFVLFFASLMLLAAFITNMAWPRPRMNDCGWVGDCNLSIAPGTDTMQIHSGITIFTLSSIEQDEQAGTLWSARTDLRKAMESVGVVMAHMAQLNTKSIPVPPGTIHISVGPRP